jgi:tRNA nucleotidyltransferase (CCA-adding enzyme)
VEKEMKTYLVGGAVRDMLMGLDPKDRDFVVVGSNRVEMLKQGFQPVGADFPVFLHPTTNEEYALARVERKTGEGYNGFETDTVGVTLEQDLFRRDLTINSMAAERSPISDGWSLIDPFGGQQDLHNKVFRHVSDAFQEDPVRVLRVARLRARYGADWKVAAETQNLMSDMAKRGDLDHLTAERVWKELSRALMEPHPRLFFDTLLECDALHKLFPEVYKLLTALERWKWHPEGNAYEHTMLVLSHAAKMNLDLECRMAALVHDFGKGLTKFEDLPSHHGHDVKGVHIVASFCSRLVVPANMSKRLQRVTRYHMRGHDLDKVKAITVVRMLAALDARRDPTIVDLLHNLFVCDHHGRLGSENEPFVQALSLHDCFAVVNSIKFADVFPNGCSDVNKISTKMEMAQVKKLHDFRVSKKAAQ